MTQMVIYEQACRAIAAAKSFDDIKDVADKAEAARAYAVQAKNRTLEIDAAEIRIRAERRLGELLIDFKVSGVGASRGQPTKESSKVTLSELGIDRNLSSYCQVLGRLDLEAFERQLLAWRSDLLFEKGKRARTKLRAPPQSAPRASHRLADGTEISRVRLGKLRSRINDCVIDLRLLNSVLDRVSTGDALATVSDLIPEAVLAQMIADAREPRS